MFCYVQRSNKWINFQYLPSCTARYMESYSYAIHRPFALFGRLCVSLPATLVQSLSSSTLWCGLITQLVLLGKSIICPGSPWILEVFSSPESFVILLQSFQEGDWLADRTMIALVSQKTDLLILVPEKKTRFPMSMGKLLFLVRNVQVVSINLERINPGEQSIFRDVPFQQPF